MCVIGDQQKKRNHFQLFDKNITLAIYEQRDVWEIAVTCADERPI